MTRSPTFGSDCIFAARDIYRRFGGLQAVGGATISVDRGSVTALIGPNGAGKTTLFNVITGSLRADAGRVEFDGEDLSRRPPYVIARRGLVRTFQISKALNAMSVLDNMMLAAPRQPGERVTNVLLRPRLCAVREQAVRERALELLDTFALHRYATEYAGTLSGGQRKLLEFARALMTEPRMLLLDEPMAGVNPTLGRRVFEHMQELRRTRGLTFLFIEHNMEMVMQQADHVLVMAQGRLIAAGSPQDVRTDPRVIDAYLGGSP